jgi:hypothetical protein
MKTHESPTDQPLDRYIDRFLFAEGWRVTEVDSSSNPKQFAVTLTKVEEPGCGRQVTRSASSAGEAAFMACSSARRPLSGT